MSKIPVIIDCDPGHDDAIALLIALANDKLDVKGITTVAGNQTLEKTTSNALKTLELCQILNIPVVPGRAAPLIKELKVAEDVHGASGMDGPVLPEPSIKPLAMTAVEFIAEQVEASATKMVLVAVGPFTNIGVFLLAYPHLHHKIAKIHVMGGGIYEGNRTQLGEANVMNDPEAAYVLANCGIPVHFFGLDVTHRASIKREEIPLFLDQTGPIHQFVGEMLTFRAKQYMGVNGWSVVPAHDVCAILSLVDETLFSGEEAYINIDLDGTVTRGSCVVDLRPLERRLGANNGVFYTDVDRPRFLQLILQSCQTLEQQMKR
jgi:pyrimidine-specific ribonucleoside hydrolase